MTNSAKSMAFTRKNTIQSIDRGENQLLASLQTDRTDVKDKFKSSSYKIFDSKTTYDKLNTVFQRIMNQELFKYPTHLIPLHYMRCLCCRKKESLKKISKPDFYYQKGLNKLEKDLDAVSFLRMVHNIDIMHSILFDEFSQVLLKF